MPIVVKVVEQDEYDEWVFNKRQEAIKLAELMLRASWASFNSLNSVLMSLVASRRALKFDSNVLKESPSLPTDSLDCDCEVFMAFPSSPIRENTSFFTASKD